MAVIERDQIRGIYVEGIGLCCMDCFEGNLEELTLDQIVTESDIEDSDDLYFCDKCNKQI